MVQRVLSDSLIGVIALPQILQLDQAFKIFNKCAVGLYSNMLFLNPTMQSLVLSGSSLVSSNLIHLPALHCCRQAGTALSTTGLWPRPLGNPIMFPINHNKLASCSFMSPQCAVCLVWNGSKSFIDWVFWQGNRKSLQSPQVASLGDGKAAGRDKACGWLRELHKYWEKKEWQKTRESCSCGCRAHPLHYRANVRTRANFILRNPFLLAINSAGEWGNQFSG